MKSPERRALDRATAESVARISAARSCNDDSAQHIQDSRRKIADSLALLSGRFTQFRDS
jgi:hypothetical protein